MITAERVFGYARVSTEDQELTLQLQALERYGVPAGNIFKEHASGSSMDRPVWTQIMSMIQEGDKIVIWKLDRLGRTLMGVLDTMEKLRKVGAQLISITDVWDTTTAMGEAMFNMSFVFAQLERRMISERTKAGIAAIRAINGGFWGRRSQIDASPVRAAVMCRHIEGEYRVVRTARRMVPILNRIDRKAETITNAETPRRWIRKNRTHEKEGN